MAMRMTIKPVLVHDAVGNDKLAEYDQLEFARASEC